MTTINLYLIIHSGSQTNDSVHRSVTPLNRTNCNYQILIFFLNIIKYTFFSNNLNRTMDSYSTSNVIFLNPVRRPVIYSSPGRNSTILKYCPPQISSTSMKKMKPVQLNKYFDLPTVSGFINISNLSTH